jgi:hypothetical protein
MASQRLPGETPVTFEAGVVYEVRIGGTPHWRGPIDPWPPAWNETAADGPTISDLLPQPTIPPEMLGATAYRWGPGAWTQDQLEVAQPWSRT